MTRRKIGKTSLGLSCSLYQHHRILENRRPGALIFRDIFSLTYFGKYLKHKKFKIHLPPVGGRVMEMRERKGREKKRSTVPFIYEHTEGVPFICVSNHCKYRKSHGNAMPAAKRAFTYLFIYSESIQW